MKKMLIKPRVRGFMCITAHPGGCEANVKRQIDYVAAKGPLAEGPRRALVIGASTGYGLASRIAAAFGGGAATLGIFFEKPGSGSRTASAGWYNAAAFHKHAAARGLYAKSINGDAFSEAVKQQAIEAIRADLGQVDLVIYSLAAPRRQHPVSGALHNSTLKPIGRELTARTINTDKEEVQEITVAAASAAEIADTVAVMGGEDWLLWMQALRRADALAPGAKTAAYTYLGAELTWDIYWNGTIGAAKQDLDEKVLAIRELLADLPGEARVAVLGAVVTQASSAIPIMPLYLSLLFKVMKEAGALMGCIEQIDLLFRESLYGAAPRLDEDGRWRADYHELEPRIQQQVADLWEVIETGNLHEIADFKGYQRAFLNLFGFQVEGVDYEAEVAPEVAIGGLIATPDAPPAKGRTALP